jgi:hypothetical protein
MNKKKTILFFTGIGLMTCVGLTLIISSCSHDEADIQPVQQQPVQAQSASQTPAPQIIERERIVERHHSGINSFLLWHYLFSQSSPTHTVEYRPAPLYHPQAPSTVVQQNVTNVTVNKTVNVNANAPSASADSSSGSPARPVVSAPAKSWWATPTQVMKASTAYPKAQNTNTGSYAAKTASYSGYKQTVKIGRR